MVWISFPNRVVKTNRSLLALYYSFRGGKAEIKQTAESHQLICIRTRDGNWI